MKFIPELTTVVFQELPDEISLAINITGCGKRCPGCHTPFLQNSFNGVELTPAIFESYLRKYIEIITAVIFFNGDLHITRFVELLDIAKSYGLKTALYTGWNDVPMEIYKRLDFLKVGEYIQELGSLSSPSTNQRMYDIKQNKDITYKFRKSVV